MPEPIKTELWGIQSLARHPDARVLLIQGKANFEAAQRMFPSNPVLGWDGKLADHYLAQLAQRQVIVWVDNPIPSKTAVAAIVPSGNVAVFSPDNPSECWPVAEAEKRHLPRQWMLTRIKPVVREPSAPSVNAQVNGSAVGAAEAKTAPAASQRVVELRTYQQAKPAPDIDYLPAKYSHDALAAAFTADNPNLRYVAGWGKWLQWNGTYWEPDGVLRVFDMARATCRRQAEFAAGENFTPGTVRSIVSANTIAAVEKLARSDSAHASTADVWDADPWLLNTPAGVVDLTDGSMRPGRPENHLSRITRVSPAGECPTWLNFLRTATGGDAELMAFMQRMAGYSLTGSVREHALFFVYGTGGNGKGTFLNMLTWILGDYAHTASMEAFTETRSDQHPTSTASLMGRRMVSAQETEEGRRWAESKIKSLTGGDPITARFMRQDEFTFNPQFKLVIVGNHKPVFRNVDDAIRRRLHLIPFTVKIAPEDVDTRLAEKLRAEAPGILAWAVAGCVEWQRMGLVPPECVKVATDDYLVSQDSMQTWIDEACEVGNSWSAKVSVLFDSYRKWSEGAGEFVIGRKRFVEAMLSRGFDKIVERNNSIIRGIHVRPDDEAIAAGRSHYAD